MRPCGAGGVPHFLRLWGGGGGKVVVRDEARAAADGGVRGVQFKFAKNRFERNIDAAAGGDGASDYIFSFLFWTPIFMKILLYCAYHGLFNGYFY
jgi:hypothetical protein